MNYLLKNNRREKGVLKQILLACAVMIVAGIFYFFAPNFVNNTIFKIARPVWNAEHYIVGQFAKISALITDKERLAKLNATLEQKLEEAEVALQSLDYYKRENEQLKLLLGRNSGEKRTLANIMAKPNQSVYDTLLLDAGLQEKIAVGDLVLAGDFVLGSIREVYANHSKAVLLSAPGEISRVLIGEEDISAEALGRGAGNFILKLPKEINVTVGDLVRLPGLNPKFFGVVLDVEQTVTSTFQSILFRMPVNINNLRWVEIVKGS